MKNEHAIKADIISKLARAAADKINYTDLDVPSNSPWVSLQEVFYSNDKEVKAIEKLVYEMTYKQAMSIEENMNQELSSGKYD
jgi:hypothetical protein